jgi:hypothetical protein
MSSIDSKLQDAWRKWAEWGRVYAVGIIQNRLLSGQMVGVRTGQLREKIDKTSHLFPGKDGFVITPGTSYGQILQVGSSAHVAKPKRKEAMRFFISGQEIFAKSVRVPALLARPFLTAAEPLTKPGLQLKLNEFSQRALDVSFEDRQIQITL